MYQTDVSYLSQAKRNSLGREASIQYPMRRIQQPKRRLGSCCGLFSFRRRTRICQYVLSILLVIPRHEVKFQPTGHDSSITVVYPGPTPAIFTVKMNSLPFVTLTWTAEDTLVAAGHDCHPVLFQADNSGWKAVGSLDDVTGSSKNTSGFSSPATPSFPGRSSTPVGRLNNEAFNRFRNADTRGTSGSASAIQAGLGGSGPGGASDGELLTVHQNTITSVRPYDYNHDGTVAKVSTTGVDGKLVIWAVSATPGSLAGKLGNMHLRH